MRPFVTDSIMRDKAGRRRLAGDISFFLQELIKEKTGGE